jgi:3-isopropylmalate/(R)-2-methylmalate dehydratase large subunit
MISPSATPPRTLFEKVWDRHVVHRNAGDGPAVLYIDLHLLHELTSRRAFSELASRGLPVRRPGRTLGTIDHIMPTVPRTAGGPLPVVEASAPATIEQMTENCRRFGVPLLGVDSPLRGIVHVIGPELGLTQPGMTVVCGDSHTSTQGAFGALAFGIGSSEVAEVLATQCLLQERPKTFEVRFDGRPGPGVTAKDLILALLARIGVDAGTGHLFEYTGDAIRSLSMEGRMTICNMSIEGGARAGMVAPDDTTFEYLAGRPFAPAGDAWERALDDWRSLPGDPEASYHRSVTIDASRVEPMVSFGTNPGMSIPIGGRVPDPADGEDAEARDGLERALAYMRMEPGQQVLGRPVDVVFIGSCTNSRISDLRLAASLLRSHRVAEGLRMLVVPGSQQVKRQAEEEGLAEVFRAAGAAWREAGCSMCIAMNGDELAPGELALSTTNRNFEGRQGQGGRTLLASPLTAAATAIAGVVADPRPLLRPALGELLSQG